MDLAESVEVIFNSTKCISLSIQVCRVLIAMGFKLKILQIPFFPKKLIVCRFCTANLIQKWIKMALSLTSVILDDSLVEDAPSTPMQRVSGGPFECVKLGSFSQSSS